MKKEFTKEEIEMIVDSLQFLSCTEVGASSDDEERIMNIAKLSAELAEDINYVSKNNEVYDSDHVENREVFDIVKPYLTVMEK